MVQITGSIKLNVRIASVAKCANSNGESDVDKQMKYKFRARSSFNGNRVNA